MPRNKDTITIVVTGTPTEVEANENAPLHTLIPKALQQTGNTGRPPEDWELKDVDGNLLDLDKKIEDFGFPDDVQLFLSLKVGVGGDQPIR